MRRNAARSWEMERWMNAVNESFQRICPLVMEQLNVAHPNEFGEIRDEDEGLFQRVQQMKQEDVDIADDLSQLEQQISQPQTAISNTEPDEAKLQPAMGSFVNEMIKLIIRVCTHEP